MPHRDRPISLSAAVLSALRLLLRNRRLAEFFQRSLADFAVGLPQLRNAGCTHHTARQLLAARLAHHHEVPRGKKRRRAGSSSLDLSKSSLLTLTDAGLRYALQLDLHAEDTAKKRRGKTGIEIPQPEFTGRALLVATAVVKEFRQRAGNQELILQAFEELKWQTVIDDPLSPVADIDPKERLRSTTQALNRFQKLDLIHFYGDGTGQRIGWEWRK